MGRMNRGSATRVETTRRGAHASAILLVALGATLGIAGGAAGALKAASDTTNIPAGEERGALAKCKAGTRAISGGFDVPGTASISGDLAIPFDSERLGRRKWGTTAFAFGVGSSDLVSYAYCSDALPKLKVRTATQNVEPSSGVTVTARCKKGGEAVSGGFAGVAVDDMTPFSSHREGKRKWTVKAFNFDSDETFILTTLAYCAEDQLGLKKRSAQTSSSDTPGSLISAEASCKSKQRVISGGYEGANDGSSVATYPFSSMRTSGRNWAASAVFDSSSPAPFDWTTFAYCIDKKELR
jgi:hypothetical protein